MQASLDSDVEAAEKLIGACLPAAWPDGHARQVIHRRLAQLDEDPAAAPWLLRLMVRTRDRVAVGYINFHGPPDDAGRVELGYTVFEEHRRRGYATEAVQAMIGWAGVEHGVRRFLLSISPSNQPSLAIAARLGFERVGSQIDEIDGVEDVFELVLA